MWHNWQESFLEMFSWTIPSANHWFHFHRLNNNLPATYLYPCWSRELSRLSVSWKCLEEYRATHVTLFVVNHHVHVLHVTRVIQAHAWLSFWLPSPECILEKGFSRRNAFADLRNSRGKDIKYLRGRIPEHPATLTAQYCLSSLYPRDAKPRPH